MKKKEIIENVIEEVKNLLKDDNSGHDFDHTYRVYKLALKIAKKEKVDNTFVISLISLLHDVDDYKLFKTENYANARTIMNKYNISIDRQNYIIEEISLISYKGDNITIPKSIEGKIVQDADRLEALGAIGICRAIQYGATKKNKLYDLNTKPATFLTEEEYKKKNSNTLNHFYEKLFKLKDLMNTQEGKKIALKRDAFMHKFINELLKEIKL